MQGLNQGAPRGYGRYAWTLVGHLHASTNGSMVLNYGQWENLQPIEDLKEKPGFGTGTSYWDGLADNEHHLCKFIAKVKGHSFCSQVTLHQAVINLMTTVIVEKWGHPDWLTAASDLMPLPQYAGW